MNFPILENQIRKQYRLFSHTGLWSQLHAADSKDSRKVVSRELVKSEEEVVEWAHEFNGQANLYIGRAARNEAGVPIRTASFTLDLDPRRSPGSASSDDQHRKALLVGKAVLKTVGGGHLCSSGNGALVIVPFTEPVTENLDVFSAQCKQFEEQLRDAFETPEVTIDATQDTARLARLLGTVNTKGPRERWRPARFFSHPVFHSKRSRIRQAIASLPAPAAFGQTDFNREHSRMVTNLPQVPIGLLPTYDHAIYPTRERAEFAFALRLKFHGFGPEDIRQQLAQYGYIQNPRDAQRVIDKLFAPGAGGEYGGRTASLQRGNGVGGLSTGSASTPVLDPLWTPAQPIGTTDSSRSGTCNELGTGFKFLDTKLGGFRPGYVYAIEAPTNVGKSTYITQVANHLARCGNRVLLVITEMDVREAITRIKAIETMVPGHVLDSGRFSEKERSAVEDFEKQLRQYQLFIRYTTSPNQAAIEEDIKASQAEVVLWDYYQHFETGTENRQVQLASLARWYESTALKYQIPFIVAAQLHRRVDFKTNKVLPSTMDQIKDCKVLNDAAKVVITLDWDQQQEQQTEDGPVPVRLTIAKNKGPMCSGVVRLVRNIPRFEDL